jgi:D-erythronate 2-dehydrogenase
MSNEMKRVLITGAGGFIGVDALAAQYGPSTKSLVTYAPDPTIDRLFGDRDSSFTTTEPESLGFAHDGTPSRLAVRALEH